MDKNACSAATLVVAAAFVAFGSGVARAQEQAVPLEVAQIVGGLNDQFRGAGDFDGDGDVDLLSFWQGTFVQHMNDGTGQFTAGAGFAMPPLVVPQPSPVIMRDLDADGRPDFVAAYGQVAGGMLTSPGSGAPIPAWGLIEAQGILAMTIGNFDGDPWLDVVTVAGNYVRLWRGAASAAPSFASSEPIPYFVTPIAQPFLLRTVDADDDGIDEVLLTGNSGGLNPVTHVRLYSGGGGTLSLAASWQFNESAGPMAAPGDIDGDQDDDVVLFYPPPFGVPGSYRVLRATPGTGLSLEPTTTGGPATALADFDGDGDLDGICCGGGGGAPANQALSTFEVSLNDGFGGFAPAFKFAGKGSAGIVGAEDLDGDGDRELIAGVCVVWNRGSNPAVTGSPFGNIASPGSSRPEWTADLDADGDLDAFHDFNFGISFNDGAGRFTHSPLPSPSLPAGTALGVFESILCDVDGDGAKDALCPLRLIGSNMDLGTRLLKNAGDGTFVDGGFAVAAGQSMNTMTPPGGGAPSGWTFDTNTTRAEDLDGDGDEDVLSFNWQGLGGLSTWINNGAGLFVAGSTLANVYVRALADLTGDGLPDLIVHYTPWGNPGNPFFALIRNVAGTYGPPAPADQYPGPPSAYGGWGVVARDLDADGDADLLRFDGAFYLNDGVGGLTFVTALSPCLVAGVLDLDGDSLPEIIVSTSSGIASDQQLWRRTSAAAPYAPVATFVLPGAYLGWRVDWDGDGDEDIAFSGGGVRNARFHGPSAGRRLQYGAGLAGLGGRVPNLGVSGPLREGLTPVLEFSGGLVGAPGLVSFGVTPISAPFLGGTLYVLPTVSLPIVLSGPAGTPAAGRARWPISIPLGFSGLQFIVQSGYADPAAPFGLSLTQALFAEIGG
jgi:hypothetical protein